jgi:hypothetical protein
MRNCTITLIVIALLQLSKDNRAPYRTPIRHEGSGVRSSVEGGIGKKRAIAIANRDAQKNYPSLSRFRIIPCAQTSFWRIIYDGGGPEYVIDRASGSIIRRQEVPQAPKHETVGTVDSNKRISKEKAIGIAKTDALRTYGDREDVEQYAIIACEQAKVWRIIFDHKPVGASGNIAAFPNGSTPKYVIDKKTGEIVHKQRN